MRVRFSAFARGEEDRARRDLVSRIEAFWAEAIAHVGSGFPGDDVRALRALERTLSSLATRVAPGLSVELDGRRASGARLVIAPFEDAALGPLVDEMLRLAPRIEGLSVVRHRPELPVADAVRDVRDRLGPDLSGARARVGFSRGHLLEVVVHSPSFFGTADELALDAANLLVPRLVGDEVFDEWVGSVDVAPLARPSSLRVVADGASARESTLPLDEIAPAVSAAIRGVDAELPAAPYHRFCERAEWTLLEMDPPLADDYSEQDDLVFLSTLLPEAMKCFLQGSRFSSRRFSRHGECFAYVKVDARQDTAERRHERRVELEDALNHALVPGGLGCVIGAGIGARYVYLELALSELGPAIEVVLRRLRSQGVPRRSWILFCDSAWAREWVGVQEDTPPPP
jgi:hypothetical protein